MTNEFENEPFGRTPEPQEPASADSVQSASIFEKTVFGSAQPKPQQPAQEQTAPLQAQDDTPIVHAERVESYTTAGTYYPKQPAEPYEKTSAPSYSGAAPSLDSRAPYAQPDRHAAHGTTTAPIYAETTSAQAKKSKKGINILLTVIALIVVCCVGILVGVLVGGKNQPVDGATIAATGADSAAQGGGTMELETKASPLSDSEAEPGAAMTPTQIAAKVRSISVGILVYSRNSSKVASEGSGVLWKEDSNHQYTYIITCAHVVSGSGLTYTVQTEDGTTYDAELVGADSKTDLAVVRIEATGLDLAEFGDSSKLQVGDPVYAIGNPGGTEFFGSFTGGIVSAIDRSVKSTNTMVCIQHTAAINPGNSGGALVNQYGQVVGINSQKIVDTEYEGMGFSIPIKSAQSVINSLASYGYVANRPKLGITYAEAVNYQQYSILIKIKGLPSGSLIITEINDDSSLAGTDVRQYDMIIKVNGEEMTKPEVLLSKIENGKVGDELTLTICRVDNNYQTKEFDVTVKLVEEKKEVEKETTTTQQYVDPYDFYNDFFKGLF